MSTSPSVGHRYAEDTICARCSLSPRISVTTRLYFLFESAPATTDPGSGENCIPTCFFSIFGGEASSHKQQIHLRKWSKNSQQDGKMLLDKEAEKPFKQVPTTVVEGGRSHCPYSITTLSGSDSWREFQSKL